MGTWGVQSAVSGYSTTKLLFYHGPVYWPLSYCRGLWVVWGWFSSVVFNEARPVKVNTHGKRWSGAEMSLNWQRAKHCSVECWNKTVIHFLFWQMNKKLCPILTLADFSFGCMLSVSSVRQSLMSMKTTELPFTGTAGSCSTLSGKGSLHYRVP